MDSLEIVICDLCHGDGVILTSPMSNFKTHTKCSKCNGSGIVVKITTVTFKPYKGKDENGNVIE